MKHIFDLEKKFREVIIFGKGPSFDPAIGLQAVMGAVGVYAVNQTAIELMKLCVYPDLTVCNDIEPLDDVINWMDTTKFRCMNQAVALPVFPHMNEKPMDIEYPDEYVRNFGQVFRYDLWTASRQHFKPNVFCVPTTYITALIIAAHLGAEKVYTNGIDGGDVRHDSFKGTKKIKPNDYMAQFETEKIIASQYNLEITRVFQKWSRMETVYTRK